MDIADRYNLQTYLKQSTDILIKEMNQSLMVRDIFIYKAFGEFYE